MKFVGVDQITDRNGNESSQIQASQIILSLNCVKFSAVFSWSTATMPSNVPFLEKNYLGKCFIFIILYANIL